MFHEDLNYREFISRSLQSFLTDHCVHKCVLQFFFPARTSKTSLTYKLLSVTEHCWRRVNHLKTLLLLTTSSVKTQKLSKLAKLWSRINEWALTSTTFVKKHGKTQNHLPAVLIILGIAIVIRINEENHEIFSLKIYIV